MKTENPLISELLKFCSPKQLRKTVMKMYFEADAAGILTQEDKDDVFFLYNFLESLKDD